MSVVIRDRNQTVRKRSQAVRLVALFVLLRPFGNLLLTWGMQHTASVLAWNPSVYLFAILNPFVISGIVALIASLLVRMAMLSVADLSFVLPITAIGYVISSVLGWLFLHEHISLMHWAGTVLVVLGTGMVSFTTADTTSREPG